MSLQSNPINFDKYKEFAVGDYVKVLLTESQLSDKIARIRKIDTVSFDNSFVRFWLEINGESYPFWFSMGFLQKVNVELFEGEITFEI